MANMQGNEMLKYHKALLWVGALGLLCCLLIFTAAQPHTWNDWMWRAGRLHIFINQYRSALVWRHPNGDVHEADFYYWPILASFDLITKDCTEFYRTFPMPMPQDEYKSKRDEACAGNHTRQLSWR